MNVMGIMQQIMSNNRVMGNPMIKNAMSMVQSGNSKGIEQMARNLCPGSITITVELVFLPVFFARAQTPLPR